MPLPTALRSLAHRDLRLFFAGQCVSLVGSWMQSVAQGWLVYRLTRSTAMLGTVGFLSQVPVFLFGIWAGSLADRVPRRRLVLATQVNALVQATILAALTLSGAVRPWHLLPLAFLLGLSYAFEIPARQALLADLAGEDMPNALALNSTIVNGARMVGPAIAGAVVAAVGEGWCFALNAASFVGTIAALLAMRHVERPAAPPPSRRRHVGEGLAYAARAPLLRALLALMSTASFFALPYVTLLPAIARDVLHGDARLLGALQGSAGAGALAAGVLLLLRRGTVGLARRVGVGAALLGAGLAGVAASRSAAFSCACLAVAGFGYLTQAAGTLTLVQSVAPPELRGRLIGVFSTLFVGVTPFGALAAGAAAARVGTPAVLGAGAGVLLLAAVGFLARRGAWSADPVPADPGRSRPVPEARGSADPRGPAA
jgi:MFS family permease